MGPICQTKNSTYRECISNHIHCFMSGSIMTLALTSTVYFGVPTLKLWNRLLNKYLQYHTLGHWWRRLQPTSSITTDAKSVDSTRDDLHTSTWMCASLSFTGKTSANVWPILRPLWLMTSAATSVSVSPVLALNLGLFQLILKYGPCIEYHTNAISPVTRNSRVYEETMVSVNKTAKYCSTLYSSFANITSNAKLLR